MGAISAEGKADSWTFDAGIGDSVIVQMGTEDISPWMRLYGPDGTLVKELTSNGGDRRGSIQFEVETPGTYTVVVAAYFGTVGNYTLYFARAPGVFEVPAGDQGGELINGRAHAGSITLADLDQWSFVGQAGDSIILQLGTEDVSPWMLLYGPDGTLVKELTSNGGDRRGSIQFEVETPGTYTVVVAAYFGTVGNYTLYFARAPGVFEVPAGDQGGELINGRAHAGSITLADLDQWSFVGQAGDSIILQLGTEDVSPWMLLYGPDGTLVKELTSNGGDRRGSIQFEVETPGTYTVVVAAYFGTVGNYTLYFAKAPGAFEVPDGDQGGELVNGGAHPGSITLADLDQWSFVGQAGDLVVLLVGTEDISPWMLLYGPDGTLLAERTSNSGDRAGSIQFEVETSGTYTLVVAAYFGTVGNYSLRLYRFAPDLVVPGITIVQESSTLVAMISAVDPETATKPLTFELLSGPSGATLAAETATNAVITWSPTEAAGPSTNLFVARVTDVVNGAAYRRTNSFSVIVQEVNSAPQLTLPGPQSLDELASLAVSVSASDADLPPNPIHFSLVSPPAGMGIDPVSGAISWTPTEAQGPSTNQIAVVATDANPLAVNEQQLSTTNTFTVVVREANRAPQLAPVEEQGVDELTPFSVTVPVNDPDLPANGLAFRLLGGPEGAAIEPATGRVVWTPSEVQGPYTHEFVVEVTDSGEPPLSATNRFSVVVREVNGGPVFEAVPAQESADERTFRITLKATDPDQPANAVTYELGATAPVGCAIHPTTGELTWPIGVRVARETMVIPVIARDDGAPAQSSETSVTVTVIPPVLRLAAIADAAVDEGQLLSVTAVVTNSPQALPPFVFSLVGIPPDGASVNAATGILFWRPSESQGPSTNALTLRVTDGAAPPHAFEQAIQVIVAEVNQAPVIAAVPPQQAVPGGVLEIRPVATDEDLPVNVLTFSLTEEAPTGMTIHPESGVLRWTPGAEFADTTNRVTVRVTDNGTPPLEATRTVQITVAAATATRLEAELDTTGALRLVLISDVGRTYLIESSRNLGAWNMIANVVTAGQRTEIPVVLETTEAPQFFRAVSP